MKSLLGASFWSGLGELLSFLPKLTYFFYATVACLLDFFQLLIRRLIGLDAHYVVSGSVNTWVLGNVNSYTEVSSDPLLDFIMGILGIGENAGVYSVLSTTFWSFAIFGLIVLVISTIVSIAKSHYQEDSAKTSPVGYIYTALKSIFTFAITPLVVIAGFWLSSFLLKTLDDITASEATDETMAGIYGPDYKQYFRSGFSDFNYEDTQRQIYTNYDVFSFGTTSSSQTLSGMMFKVAANGANRLRTGDLKFKSDMNAWDWIAGVFSGLNFQVFYGVRGTFSEPGYKDWYPSGITTMEEKYEWTAYQVDYAFANNLALADQNAWMTPAEIQLMQGNIPALAGNFLSNGLGILIPAMSFSKYNIELVWCFYNLWNFNFIVGFGGISVMFGLMYSIILGLMSRIIKGIALFLIYPATLGLAPLDDWKAFKKWREEFVSQVLMGFGAIIGINLFFLILPYLSQIKFFPLALLNYIVETLMAIAGLVMVKDFIKFLSSLIGGADANATGEGMKKDVKDALQKGIKGTLIAGKLAWDVGTAVMPVGKILKMGKASMLAEKAASLGGKAAQATDQADRLKEYNALVESYGETSLSSAKQGKDQMLTGHSLYADFKQEAEKKGLKGKDIDDEAKRLTEDYISRQGSDDEKNKLRDYNKTISQKGLDDGAWQEYQENEAEIAEYEAKAKGYQEDAKEKQDAADKIKPNIRTGGKGFVDMFLNPKVGFTPDSLGKITNSVSAGILKGFKAGLGLDLGGMFKAVQESLNPPELIKPTKPGEQRAKMTDSIKEGFWKWMSGAPKEPPKATGDKALNDVAESNDKVSKKLDEVVKTLDSFIKKVGGP